MASPGGNKKSSSKSDQNYWARATASKFSETHSARRIARHKKRMAKKAEHRKVWEAKQPARRRQAMAA